jgi:hypothetical protein
MTFSGEVQILPIQSRSILNSLNYRKKAYKSKISNKCCSVKKIIGYNARERMYPYGIEANSILLNPKKGYLTLMSPVAMTQVFIRSHQVANQLLNFLRLGKPAFPFSIPK